MPPAISSGSSMPSAGPKSKVADRRSEPMVFVASDVDDDQAEDGQHSGYREQCAGAQQEIADGSTDRREVRSHRQGGLVREHADDEHDSDYRKRDHCRPQGRDEDPFAERQFVGVPEHEVVPVRPVEHVEEHVRDHPSPCLSFGRPPSHHSTRPRRIQKWQPHAFC
jgi:hypothetical protein